MRNTNIPKINKIISLAERLPYFNFSDIVPVEKNKTYLKVLFSRYEKKEKLFRLKKDFIPPKSM